MFGLTPAILNPFCSVWDWCTEKKVHVCVELSSQCIPLWPLLPSLHSTSPLSLLTRRRPPLPTLSLSIRLEYPHLMVYNFPLRVFSTLLFTCFRVPLHDTPVEIYFLPFATKNVALKIKNNLSALSGVRLET